MPQGNGQDWVSKTGLESKEVFRIRSRPNRPEVRQDFPRGHKWKFPGWRRSDFVPIAIFSLRFLLPAIVGGLPADRAIAGSAAPFQSVVRGDRSADSFEKAIPVSPESAVPRQPNF